MQINEFRVEGLFHRFDHHIDFPAIIEGDPRGSLIIVYGANGVGKTTVLRMLNALLAEEAEDRFDIFRAVPFDQCTLTLSGLPPIVLKRAEDDLVSVHFRDQAAAIPTSPPPAVPTYTVTALATATQLLGTKRDESAARLHAQFRRQAAELSFEFIQTARLEPKKEPEGVLHTYAFLASPNRPAPTLSERMKGFIASAQLDYSSFFSTNEPDLFSKIIARLTTKPRRTAQTEIDVDSLLARLTAIHDQDSRISRLGLGRDSWNYQELVARLRGLPKTGSNRAYASLVTQQYVEVLESRAAERALIADRLETFEQTMAEFYSGKRITVSSREGLHIETDDGGTLTEEQLSSGERHLLYLMVSATVTRRVGTVIAIDEPEMSIHIAWQRKLIPALLRCAANAAPQFIFATHSPQLAAEYPDALRELS